MPSEIERIVLREPEESDVETLRAYHRRNAERFARYDAVPGDDPAAHVDWIRAHRAMRRHGHPVALLAFDRASAELVGVTALSGFNTDPPSAMISYSVDGAYEGKGYAFEMARHMLRHAFQEMGLASVSASVRVGNERSLQLLARLGFTVVARSPEIPGLEHLFRPHVLAMLERSEFAALGQ
jgi:[ribosomal protein S5]-alanine N-acetyltransferase